MLRFWWPFRRKHSTLPLQAWARTTPTPTRRYLEGADYLLPKDSEEEARLNFQHYALNLTLGNHYLAPLPPLVRTILDVGTGSGVWSCDMARLFPGSLVLGLDLDSELFNKTPPPNCLMREGDILNGLPLPDQIMELTHQRFLVLAIPDARWPEVIRELVRVTCIGGWVELVETDARVQAAGPATEQVFAWIATVRNERGMPGKAILHLGEMLRHGGIQEIEEQSIPIKVGTWGGRAGQMMAQDVLAGVQALKEPCCAHGVSPHEFDACVQAMATEWKQAHGFCTIYIAYGKRVAP